MKGLRVFIIVGLLAFFLAPSVTKAQRNIIKFDVLGPVAGQYMFAYERAVLPHLSLQVAGGLINADSKQYFTNGSSITRYRGDKNGYIVVPELRLYLRGCAPRGFYVQGYGRYKNTVKTVTDMSFPQETDVSHREYNTTVGGGVGLGVNVIILRTVSLDFNAGPQFRDRNVSREYLYEGVSDADFDSKFIDISVGSRQGLTMRGQITLGVAF